MNPNINNMQASLSPPFLIVLKCIYSTYESHVTSAHVSFGSHAQKCPHASFAHNDPESIPKVRKAVPMYTSVSAACIISSSFLKSLTNAAMKAHPSSEYENIYTVT